VSNRRLILGGLLLAGAGCVGTPTPPPTVPRPGPVVVRDRNPGEPSDGTVEGLLADIDALPEGVTAYELFVPRSLTYHGRPIPREAALAVVLDRLIPKNLYPDGFEDRPTGRRYRYTSRPVK